MNPQTVLVIDDNPAVVTALEVLFSLRDIRTVRAATPQEGLALLERGMSAGELMDRMGASP